MALPDLPRPGRKMEPKAYCLELHRIRYGSHARRPDLQHLLRQILARDIDEWRKKSFDNFIIEVGVTKFEGSESYIDEDGDHIGWYTYNFQLVGSEASKLGFEKALSIRYARGEIQVRFHKIFQKIDAYLDTLKASLSKRARSLDQAQQFTARIQQTQWWDANGKNFPLMDLPQELREAVYGYALEGSVEPYARARCRKLGRIIQSIANRQPKTSIFRTNHQVYQEASHVFFLYNTFLIEYYGVFRKVVQNEDLVARVRRLKLALDHSGFLRLFGVDHDEGLLLEAACHGDALRSMKLNHLELCFTPPSSISEWTWLDNTCHKEVVDLILTAAWPFIKGHPVILTGYVKTQQVKAFAAKNAEEKSKVDVWNQSRAIYELDIGTLDAYDFDQLLSNEDDGLGGARLNGVESDVETTPSKHEGELDWFMPVPGACKCEPACTLDEWTP